MNYFTIADKKRISADIPFCLDFPKIGNVAISSELEVVGWIYLAASKDTVVHLAQGENFLGSGSLVEFRPKVAKRFGLTESHCTGFRFKVDCNCIDFQQDLTLIAIDSGEVWEFCSLQVNREKWDEKKRLFFMHIPKTAGSSTNDYMSSQCAHGQFKDHIEHLLNDPDTTEDMFSKLLYISGHVRLGNERLQRLLQSFSFCTATLLREPTEQLLSHLSWVKRLGLPEYRKDFEDHPPNIQKIAKRLNAVKFEDFAASMTIHERNLFDNNQTRYLCGFSRRLEDKHVQQALRNLEGFDVVGVNENYPAFLKALSRLMSWKPPQVIPRANISSYRLRAHDLGVDSACLKALTQYDQIIYERAMQLCAG